MSEKYLPIKIFEKRKDYDDRSTEGGGDSHEGSWVLHGEELNKRVDYLSKNVNTIQDSFQKWKENKRALPMIISTTVIDKAIAKTHRGRIVNLLENDGKDNVIGVYGDRQLLSMVTEESLLSTISQVIGRREDEATLISSISGIDVFSPFVEPYDSDNNVYRVRLCDYNDFDLNNMAKILFEQSCEAAGIKIHSKVRFTTDMTIYRVTIDNLEQLNAMGEFESVYSAEKTYPIIDLADMTPSNRDKWLPSTRKWYLKIEGLYRDFIEKEAVKKDFQLSQEYCMILTIRDPEHTAPVYDEVTQQLTNRNFIHHDVRVRNVVHVTNE